MAGDTRAVLRQDEIDRLMISEPVVQLVVARAEQSAQRARAKAPVSPSGSHGRQAGYLRDNIKVRHAQDAVGVYADAVSTAHTPAGYPYGKLQEERQPYMRPSI